MTDFERLKMVVGLVTYKPGWQFEVSYVRTGTLGYGYFDHAALDICYLGLDVGNPEKKVVLTHSSVIDLEYISKMTNEDIVHRFISHGIREAELHEMDEWLKYAGRNVREPHPDKTGNG